MIYDIEDLKNKISTIRSFGEGSDEIEDWEGGYDLVLYNMNWRKEIKLIMNIEDDGDHGEEFRKGDIHSEEGIKLT